MTTTLTPSPAAGTAPAHPGEDRAHLLRVRSGVRAALVLGVAASVAGNVLHAEPTIVGRAISAWSPLALLLTVELISRVPVSSRRLAVLRMLSTALIAAIAAWVSYWHMVSVAAANGESNTSAHLLPLSVDGLVVVASVSLVEIAARLRHTGIATAPVEEHPTAAPAPTDVPVTEPAPAPAVAAPGARTRRPAGVSAAVTVARLRDKHPDWTHQQIAAKAGVTERTVRRHLSTPPADSPAAPAPAEAPGIADSASAEIAA